MDTKTTKRGLLQLLGVAFFVQALTSLIAGMLFLSLESKENIKITMCNIANNISTIYVSTILWIVTAVVIIILGVAIYRTAGHINNTMAMIALSFYLVEAVLIVAGQAFIFGLVKASQLYLTGGDAGLLSLGNVLLSCRHFAGEMAMIPFGLGAFLFYYLLMKAGTIPKWLALWGLITVSIVPIVVSLGTFGIAIPFALCFPYVPFEFFTGIYILVRYRKKIILKADR